MLPFFGSVAITIAALTSAPNPAEPAAAQAAPVTAPVVVANTPRRRRHANQAAVQVAAPDSAGQAIEEQIRLRVLMPALSGDGGG